MKTCPQCAEQVQDAAQVCRFCRYDFIDQRRAAPRQRQTLGCGGALALCVGLVLMLAWCRGDPADLLEQPGAPAVAAEQLPAATVAKCREMLALAVKEGVIRERPEPNRINVEDRMWAQLDAGTKNRMMQAVACDVWQTAMPPGEPFPGEHVVAYGYRSGKRLQMLTSVGMDRE